MLGGAERCLLRLGVREWRTVVQHLDLRVHHRRAGASGWPEPRLPAARERAVAADRQSLALRRACWPAAWQNTNPLLRALEKKHRAVVKLLVAGGADVQAATATGETAAHAAFTQGLDDVFESFVEAVRVMFVVPAAATIICYISKSNGVQPWATVTRGGTSILESAGGSESCFQSQAELSLVIILA